MTEPAATPSITLADEAMATLRAEVKSLLGLIDTARRPEPAGVVPHGKRNPGPVWQPLPKWKIRHVDDEGEFVYVTTPADCGGDYDSMRPEEARALAMSLLAAADWAENSGPARRGRYPEFDEERQPGMFICGPDIRT